MPSPEYQRVVRSAMRHHGDTERTMATALQVSQTTVHAWLNGTLPRGPRLRALAGYVGIHPDRLAGIHAGLDETPTVPAEIGERLGDLEQIVRDHQRTLAALTAAVAELQRRAR